MSHLHIPDGVLPLAWILLGFILTGLGLGVSVLSLARRDRARVVPRIAILSAIMILAMGLPIPVLNYHVNLTVLTGILAGPAEGFIAVFITNLFLALTAHGGITVLGLNTIVTGLEVVVGWALWRAFSRAIRRPFAAAAVTTILALAVSTTAMLGIVRASQVNPSLLLHHHHESEEAHIPENEDLADEDHHDEGSFSTFAKVVYTAGAVGWVLEAVVVGSVTQFIAKARPEMLKEA
ncbi:MAG: energy-coupling factor ABC transporter permease [Clostridia bacterium]|nr:energy-coupling factor ABC transporter permease [Clostridia bacterium]